MTEVRTARSTSRSMSIDLGALVVPANSGSRAGRRLFPSRMVEKLQEGASFSPGYEVTVSGYEQKADGTQSVRHNTKTWTSLEDVPAELRELLVGPEALRAWQA